eukprot:TRINITY_DN9054_c0_g1_i1.p1 TRINITY_DN9054_c0_g1~~TRINITY_DN9054_c0_g1_i1.p1  ORF type:complete len:548 (+),score=97.05 TRINITY_DN9054_c0_g1_i1:48-1691(+)
MRGCLLVGILLLHLCVESRLHNPGVISLSRNTTKARSRFSEIQDSVRVIPISGSFKVAEYYFELSIGTPPKQFFVQMDTGSSSTAIPMVGCKEGPQLESCHVIKQPYDPVESSSSKLVLCNSECSYCYSGACGFRLQYGDGSKVEGMVYEDTVAIGEYAFQMVFGGVKSSSSGFERGPVDGISGFATMALSPSSMDPFFDAFRRSNSVANIFSICMGWEGGYLVLGGYDPKFNAEEIKYVPMLFSNFYSISIRGLSIDAQPLALKAQDFSFFTSTPVVDSGTTLMVFPPKVYNEIKAFLQSKYCSIPGVCPDEDGKTMFDGYFYRIASSQLKAFPTMKFQLDSEVVLDLSPEYYLSEIDGYTGLGFSVGNSVPTILGNTFMRAYTIIFDNEAGMLGFSKSANCHGVAYTAYHHAGDLQSGTVSMRLKNPLQVKVLHASTGKPAVGVSVRFSIDYPKNAGHLSQPATITNEYGVASTGLYFGSVPGQYYVSAFVQNAAHSPVTFVVIAETMIAFYVVAGFIMFIVLSIASYTVYAWWKKRRRIEAERV